MSEETVEVQDEECEEQNDTRALMIHSIDSDLIKEFKILCLEKEITMQRGVAEAIEDYIEIETEELKE